MNHNHPTLPAAENDKLRGILEGLLFGDRRSGRIVISADDEDRIRGALMQAEPVEPAPAQDEREAYSVWRDSNVQNGRTDTNGYHAFKAGAAWQRTRPAQTEQQPVACRYRLADGADRAWTYSGIVTAPADGYDVQYLYAAPVAQTAQQHVAYAVFAENGDVICLSIWREHPSLVALERNGHSVVTLAPIAQTEQPEQSGLVEALEAFMSAGTEDKWSAAYDKAKAAIAKTNGCSALADVAAERRRQIEAEGWVPEHDDEHSNGEMALAAACYARAGSGVPMIADVPLLWPWTSSWWKPAGARRNLVKAAALILAEIERLDRAAARAGGDA